MSAYTDKEWDCLPHFILTAGKEWSPKVLDNVISGDDDWYNKIRREDDEPYKSLFDSFGNYKGRENVRQISIVPPIGEDDDTFSVNLRESFAQAIDMNARIICGHEVKESTIDYEKYCLYFLHVSKEKVRHTFNNTTRFAGNVVSGHNIQQTMKSPYPVYNV